MSSAAARLSAWRARAAITLALCPAVARGEQPGIATPPADVLDPGSPLAPLPDLGVDWPDLSRPDEAAPLLVAPGPIPTLALPPPPPAAPVASRGRSVPVGEQRYTIRLDGLEDIGGGAALRTRFDELSVLHAGLEKPANVAQIDRRARQDAGLLRELLRAAGYYDAEVDTRVALPTGPVAGTAQRLQVALLASPGQRYAFAEVHVSGLAAAGEDAPALRSALALKPGDPADADRVNGGIAALRAALGARGYAFAVVADPDITINHDTHRATLALAVTPGARMRIGAIRLEGHRVFGPRHVTRISRLKPGDRYNAERLDDLRRALVATGLVSVVQIRPVRTADPQVVDLAVRLEPAPPRTVAAAIGYGTGEGASVELSWQHRNLLPPEGAVTFRGKAGTQEQLVSAQLRRGNFRQRDQVFTAQIAADHQKRPAYDANTFSISAGIERQTNIVWQKKWTWSYGVEFATSDERDVIAATGQPRRRTYYIAAVPTSLAYDGSDDLLNPSSGYRLAARVSPELSLQGSAFGYARLQIDGSAYQPLGDRIVLAARVRLGSIQGASRDRIAPTRRFYAGGGGSVRGFGYQRIGPRDVDNDPIGGRSLAEFGTEARFRFGNFGIVPFLDGGNLYTAALPRFTGFRFGTGLGVRYYTSFGPIRVDVGTPINRQPGDSRVAIYVSLGQAF
ncbi:autotransporter assembly complex protein TamA [Sphingomonas morindae]|uniref:BamA/TamA family outer membrane protein n=1 Tax=Sphingomonas morindae TaxID=1541170 RepID=A0ABY4XA71_9SPHN|nr:BamA/TamA family outer membrane protein [Sphingomonas morindae]USI73837.1 BamA/TamA family outer membrane protein [Sphingomonas morindae]